ncbi:MAG TPA: hypothetical protein VK483_09005 [Chitinophagaceae bacterium]|nr:hypothetical protein [Chitinophagaceae bacterium]
MIRLFILLFLLSANMMVLAQKDSTIRIKNEAIKNNYREPIKLTTTQQQWLNNNYKKIAGLKKDSATAVIRKNFTSVSEASLEYMINQALALQKGDNQQQLTVMKQMLNQLKQQKQALLKKLQEKEDQLAKETDPAKRKAITNEILELKKKIRESEDNIRRKEEAVRQMEANS